MKFNPREIQKFYDIWAPMLEALPAVINAAERGDELERSMVTLENQLKGIQKKIADEEARVAPARAEVDATIAAIQTQKAEAERGYKKYLADAKAHLDEVAKETEDQVVKIKDQVSIAMSELAQAKQEVSAVKAQAAQDIAIQKAAAEAELADIAAKKQVVEKALAALKAKIG